MAPFSLWSHPKVQKPFVGNRAQGVTWVTFRINCPSKKGQHLMPNPSFISGQSHTVGDTVWDFTSLESSTTGGNTKPRVSSFHVISWHKRKHPPWELESGKYTFPYISIPLIYKDSRGRHAELDSGNHVLSSSSSSFLLWGQWFSHLPGNQVKRLGQWNVQLHEAHEGSRSDIRAKPLISEMQASCARISHHGREC